MKYPSYSRPKKYSLKGHTKTAVMAVITRPKSCGKALMSIPASVSIVARVGRMIMKELKYMNCGECLSTFTDSSVQSMTTCTWNNLWEEVEQCCPTLSHVFTAITARQKRSIPTLCVIVAMLLKLFNQKANLVQSLLSVVLYSGGCNINPISPRRPKAPVMKIPRVTETPKSAHKTGGKFKRLVRTQSRPYTYNSVPKESL